jgi:hypothetical protein
VLEGEIPEQIALALLGDLEDFELVRREVSLDRLAHDVAKMSGGIASSSQAKS